MHIRAQTRAPERGNLLIETTSSKNSPAVATTEPCDIAPITITIDSDVPPFIIAGNSLEETLFSAEKDKPILMDPGGK